MIACAKGHGITPYNKTINIVSEVQFSSNKNYKTSILITGILVTLYKEFPVGSTSVPYCYALSYKIHIPKALLPKTFYFRFTPTENYDKDYKPLPLAILFYEANEQGAFIKDLSGVYPYQFFDNSLYKVFTDVLTREDSYVKVDLIDSKNYYIGTNLVTSYQDNVWLEISEYSDFHQKYKFKIKE